MNFSDSLQRFRVIAIAEGISFLILLLIAMPLKYMFDIPLPVKITGWIHGFLFVLFGLALLQVWIVRKWPFKYVLLSFLASLIPGGTFWLDRKLLSKESIR